MLPKTSRLPYPQQKEVLKRGRRIQTAELELIFWPTTTSSKWAFLVPKKIVPQATKRNRIKRLLSEVVFSLSPAINSKTDNIIKVKKDFSELNLTEAKFLVEMLLKKVNQP